MAIAASSESPAALRALPVRWLIAAQLLLASVLNYIDRQTLSVLAPAIQKDLGISGSGYALVVQSFLLFYTVLYVLSGRSWTGWARGRRRCCLSCCDRRPI